MADMIFVGLGLTFSLTTKSRDTMASTVQPVSTMVASVTMGPRREDESEALTLGLNVGEGTCLMRLMQ